MRLIFYVLLFLIFISPSKELLAQKKLVIMGSSTAQGTGATVYDSSWAGRITNYYNQNNLDGQDTTVTNIAIGGYTSYSEMPTGFIPPPYRPSPDPNYNVTKALSYNPDVIIINLPSNDMASGFSKIEFMDNLRIMYQTITSAGVKCYISTSQPRNDLGDNWRDSLRTLVDSINNNFGIYSVNFWVDVATTDGLNHIKPEVSYGDQIHLNNLGHNYLYIRVRDKQIFLNVSLPLILTDFRAYLQNNTVVINWRTEREESNTFFDIQRSSDGLNFESIYRQVALQSNQGNFYSWTDTHSLVGRIFYRLKLTENNKVTYSKTVSVINKINVISIDKVYKNNPTSLTAVITVQKSQEILTSILNMSGQVIQRGSEYITAPSKIISLPIEKLPAGQYLLRIDGSGSFFIRPFNK